MKHFTVESSSQAKTKQKSEIKSKTLPTSQTLCKEVLMPPPGEANALNINRKFYRDPPYGNLMFDPRVCRGSPFAHSRTVRTTGGDAQVMLPPKKKAKTSFLPEEQWRPLTPPPVDGRVHASVQTERYLEVLFDFPSTNEMECQTDLFMDRPSSPYYVTEKVGEDVDTQIYPGDLWDFDREVHPIVEVLIGRTIELAMIEVLEEDEIENMKEQQRRFEELREGERAEQRRLEEQERRLHEEKERRIKQFKDAMRVQQETSDRIAAAVLTQGYLADLLPNVLEGLTQAGYLLQDIKGDMQEHVIPWLMDDVNQHMEIKVKVQDIMTSIVRRIVEARALTYRLLGEDDDQNPRQPCIPVDTLSASESDIKGSYKEYIKDMGSEEREPHHKEPEIPMKGLIRVKKPFSPASIDLQKPKLVQPELAQPEPEANKEASNNSFVDTFIEQYQDKQNERKKSVSERN